MWLILLWIAAAICLYLAADRYLELPVKCSECGTEMDAIYDYGKYWCPNCHNTVRF